MPETNSKNCHEGDKTTKTLGHFASIALITNNIIGPAMMGIPFLFVQAGILPVVFAVILAWLCSSLCGTLLADTIGGISGNSNFNRHVMFSSAFQSIIGGRWYMVAEALFLSSCMIQACAGLVETAHALDGFLASFLINKTYALQIMPSLRLLVWSPTDCNPDGEYGDKDVYVASQCTPFYGDGPLIITLGFVLVTILFLPLGLGHLKETMVVQYISFFSLMISVSQFEWEFLSRGLVKHIPWVGNNFSSLAGVILFNYAVTLTIPSWLNEKTNNVSVNHTIWTATTLASVLYLSFGMMASMAFEGVTEDMLTILTSSQ
eukprot:gene12983-27402_t